MVIIGTSILNIIFTIISISRIIAMLCSDTIMNDNLITIICIICILIYVIALYMIINFINLQKLDIDVENAYDIQYYRFTLSSFSMIFLSATLSLCFSLLSFLLDSKFILFIYYGIITISMNGLAICIILSMTNKNKLM